MENDIIQIKNVKKSYKAVKVLKGVDLEVEQGGIFASLGSNGAGKTTMIALLMGFRSSAGILGWLTVFGIRNLLANQPVENDIWVALAWCIAIIVVAYIFAMRSYKKL